MRFPVSLPLEIVYFGYYLAETALLIDFPRPSLQLPVY